MNNLTVFYGTKQKITGIKELLRKKLNYVEYSEFDFRNISTTQRFELTGEGKIILSTFQTFVTKTLTDVKSKKLKGVTAFIDGFISYLDECIDVGEYVTPLIEACDVLYFTTRDSDLERLKELNATVYKIN